MIFYNRDTDEILYITQTPVIDGTHFILVEASEGISYSKLDQAMLPIDAGPYVYIGDL